jgi:uncharacterized protein
VTAGAPAARPFFLPAQRRIFAIHHAPAGAARGALVFAPPFAEEMNKSRRMVALQARALAAAGWHVLLADPQGTGDSEGDFGDARWANWIEDMAAARAWLAAQAGMEPWLWGLRSGALLAAALAAQRVPAGLLLWQPVLSGRQHLQQFLRLKAGAEWLASERAAKEDAKPLAALQAGQAVEVAGYRLDPALALPLAEAAFAVPAALPRLVWLEVSARADATVSPASQRVLTALPAGVGQAAVVQGPSFWQALEIETAPALIDATLKALAP